MNGSAAVGRLIHSSFGKGWLLLPFVARGCRSKPKRSLSLCLIQWGAGVMRFAGNPADGQLYGSRLSGWQGPRRRSRRVVCNGFSLHAVNHQDDRRATRSHVRGNRTRFNLPWMRERAAPIRIMATRDVGLSLVETIRNRTQYSCLRPGEKDVMIYRSDA